MLCAAILKMHPFAADAPSAAEIDRQVSAATGYISLYILVVSPVMVRRSAMCELHKHTHQCASILREYSYKIRANVN